MGSLYNSIVKSIGSSIKSFVKPQKLDIIGAGNPKLMASTTQAAVGSNWANLQKNLPKDVKPKDGKPPRFSKNGSGSGSAKGKAMGIAAYASRVQGSNGSSSDSINSITSSSKWESKGKGKDDSKLPPWKRYVPPPVPGDTGVVLGPLPEGKENDPLVQELRSLVSGLTPLTRDAQKAPGNYMAIDCEMVGTGPNGSQSVLARVSLVNYHGHILVDSFVKPKERVTDWRTWVSGVRASDMVNAKSFEEVQKEVADIVEGKILIGHAVENDTKALLLSHPSPLLRDTQTFKTLREVAKTKKPGLKKLTELELGLKIQAGAHSSVTDARATMALYRLHMTEWEATVRKATEAFRAKTSAKRKQEEVPEISDDDDEDGGAPRSKKTKSKSTEEIFPGGGRKGISSGLSTVVKYHGKNNNKEQRPPQTFESVRTRKENAVEGNWWA
ncbi:hypothetical protein QFC22_002106 [Naganishia vaughanmartiniae]|uniref:Uncharacterized protein n=1 Tax=Naganishia vaughanmartiniae TaxID=1424756 RepID=A0ACC2XD19_9TREE|nr:hypothetical protein QFC22_002106 [Naganishia vaughanmartiniae]